MAELEKELEIIKQRDESDNIDRSNWDNWIKDLKEKEKLISDKHLKALGLT